MPTMAGDFLNICTFLIALITLATKGVLSDSTESLILSRGSNHTLECITKPGSETMYIWLFNVSNTVCSLSDCSNGIPLINTTLIFESVIATTQSLDLTTVSVPENGGSYACVVVDDLEVNVTIYNLYFEPEIITTPSDTDVDATVNDDVVLNCNAEAYPSPNFQWQRLVGLTYEDLEGENNSQIQLPQVSLSDSGTYRCVASNTINGTVRSAEQDFNLNVHSVSPNGTVAIGKDEYLLEQGDPLELNCTAAAGSNNTLKWLLNNVEITDGTDGVSIVTNSTATTSVLTVNSIDASKHKGEYTCQVTNDGGQGLATTVVIVSPAGLVSVDPDNVLTSVNSNIILNCVTDAGPNIKFLWLFMPSAELCETASDCVPKTFNATEVSAIVVADSLSLTIDNVTSKEAGEYMCFAVNDAGIETAKVLINLLPKLLEEPQDVGTAINQSVTFRCSVEGFPFPSIVWQKLADDGGNFVDLPGENGTVLSISPVKLSDAGVYQCVASNDINGTNYEVSANATLAVSPEDSITFVRNSDNDFEAVKQGDRLDLVCQAGGSLDSVFQWRLNGEIIEENGSISITTSTVGTLSNSTLTISSINASDHKGNYTCQVTNDVGQANITIPVIVSPVGIVTVTPDDVIVDPGDNITFNAQTDAGPYTEYLWIFDPTFSICRDGNAACEVVNASDYSIISTDPTLQLTNISGSENGGSYFVAVINDAGFEVIVRNIYMIPQFLQEPQDILTMANESVSFSVTIDGAPFPSIQWQRLVNGSFEDIPGENQTTLQFNPVGFSDAGVYRSVISNTINDTVNEVISREAFISASLEDTTVIEGSDGLVNQNEELYLMCSAQSGPNTTYKWTLNGQDVVENDVLNITTIYNNLMSTSTLRISSVDAATHKGNYTCTVSNPAGEDSTSIIIVVSPVGIVTVTPDDVIVDPGDNITFNAQTDAGPYTEYLWIFDPTFSICIDGNAVCEDVNASDYSNNSIISTDPMLQLTNISGSENGGSYFVAVINDAGFEVIVRNIYMIPQFLQEPQDISTMVNESVSLSVTIDGAPFPSIQWQKRLVNGSFEDIPGENQTTLQFNPVDFSDAGVYRSVISSTVNNTIYTYNSRNATVSVSFDDSVIIEGTDGLTNQGEELYLKCSAPVGGNVEYQWTRDGENVTESDVLNITTIICEAMSTSTLRIDSIDAAAHKGNYTCIVSSDAGEDTSSIIVIVSPVNITSVTPEDVIGTPEDNVTFTAETDAGPDTEIIWQFSCSENTSFCNSNAQTVNLSAGIATVTSPTIMLTNISASENGKEYTAIIQNAAGTETITRNIFFFPLFIEQPSNVDTDVNEPVVLTAVVSGFPYPNIQWQKQVEGTFKDLPGENQTILNFASIDYINAGVYRIVVTSTINETVHEIISDEVTITISLKDSAMIEGTNGFVDQSDELTITCIAQGGPNNTYVWTYNGEPVVESSVLSINTDVYDTFSNSTLTITSIDAAQHKGNYTCRVSNKLGDDTTSVIVIVSPRNIVTVTPETIVASTGDNVTFTAITDAGPGTQFLWLYDPTYLLCVDEMSNCQATIQDTIVNNTSVISTEPTLSLTNISSLINGGTYYSIVVNDAGYEITPRSIYFLPRFLRQPEDVFADVNDSVAFTVEVDGSPFPNIQWQRLVDDNFENLPGKNQTILLFESVDFSDAGIYRSVISITINSTEYTVNSTEVALAVSLEDTATIMTNGSFVDEGEEFVITCNALGGPNNTYKWTLNGEEIVESDVLNITTVTFDTMSTSTLRISSVDAATHKGNYTCTVSNTAGEDTTSIVLVVSPVGIVDITPEDMIATRGDNVTFMAMTDAGPDTVYAWIYDPTYTICVDDNAECEDLDAVANISDYYIISADPTLPLTNISGSENGGRYILVAINDAGFEIVIRNLYFLPEFLEEPQDVLTDVNQSVSLNVVIDGSPMPTIRWQRLVEGYFNDIPDENQTTLQFNPVGFSDAGVYRSVIFNTINGTVIEVISREAFISVSLKDTAVIEGTDGIVEQNGEVVIICNAEGGPNNTYEWTLNGEVVESDVLNITTVISHTMSTSTLRISSVDAATHQGNYTCTVSNNAGEDSTSIVVTVSPNGIVTVTPEDVIASTGDNITFVAMTDAGPGTTFAWIYDPTFSICGNSNADCPAFNTSDYSNYSVISTDPILPLTNVTASEDGGRYIGIVRNDAGVEVIVRNVFLLPQFTEEPQDVITDVNETVLLSVAIDGAPLPSIQWQRLVNGSFEDIPGENQTTLQFNPVGYSDAGVYRSVISSTINDTVYSETSRAATLSVSLKDTSVIEGTTGLVGQGDEVVIICNAQGGPNNTYKWALNGEEIVESDVLNITTVLYDTMSTSTLRISSVDAATHKGNYTCTVSNTAGEDTTSIVLVVSPVGIVDITPEDMIATRGDNVTFMAMTDAGPDTVYAWIYDPTYTVCVDDNAECEDLDAAANISDYSIISTDPTLPLTDISGSEDGGRYIFVAINDAGFEIVIRNLYFLPEFLEEPQDVLTDVNETVLLSVTIDGSPMPTIRWQILVEGYFNDIPGENQTTLQFNPVGFSDAGVYRSVISNTINGTVIEVISREAFISVSLKDTAVIEGTDGIVEQNGEVVIICNAEGGPNNTYKWTLNGEEVVESDVLNITTVISHTMSTSTLRISSVDAATHQGNYTCTVSNNAGEDSTSIVVTVSPNGIVTVTPEDVIASTGDNITFVAMTDAGPGTTFAWIYDPTFSICGNSNADCPAFNTSDYSNYSVISTDPILPLTNVTASEDGGRYIGIVRNDAGVEVIVRNVFLLPQFTEEPQDVITDVNETVLLSVAIDGAPLPSIQWQRLVNGSFEDIPGENQTTLQFNPVGYSDAGVYRSVISSTINDTVYSETSRAATLSVSLKDTSVIEGTTGLVGQGDEVVIICNAQGGPNNTYKWALNGEEIVESDVLNITTVLYDTMSTSTLRISSVDAATHKGNYTCTVSNTAGEDTTSIVLVVSPVGIVDITPEDMIATRGDNVTFMAMTDAGPDTEYAWIYDPTYTICVDDNAECEDLDAVANISDYYIISADPTLPLTNISGSEDGGRYILVAINNAGFEIVIRNLYFLPEFLEEPQDVLTDVNETVLLSVAIDGSPLPSIQWQRLVNGSFEDIPGENQTMLQFNPVGYSDAGVYRSVISSTFNDTVYTETSRAATISVSLKDTSVIEGTTGLVGQGDEVVIICNAQGGPNNTYKWTLNGEEIVESDVLNITTVLYDTMSTSTLRISSVDAATHKGNYTCTVSNNAGEDSTSIVVTVSPEGIVSTNPTNTTLTRGNSVTFDCQTDAGPQTSVFWFHNATNVFCNVTSCYDYINEDLVDVSINILSYGTMITITNITGPNNGGVYTCVAINDAGNETSTSVLNIEPEFTEEPRNTNTTVGNTINLTCLVESYPFPAIQWQKKDNTSGVFEDINGENSTIIEIDTNDPEKSGIYRCRASAVIDNEEMMIISSTATVSISLSGTLSLMPQQIQLEYGSNLTLYCSVGGGPDNTFDWYLNGSMVTTPSTEKNITIVTSEFESILTIDFLASPLHGGTFVCEASNAISQDSNGTTVFVKPRFLQQPTSIFVEVNTTQQLDCLAESYPFPDYRWSKTNSSSLNETMPSLMFDPIQFNDFGYYTCHVESYGITIDSDSATVHISPIGSVEIIPSLLNAVPDETITLTCTAKGGPNNEFNWIFIPTEEDVASTSIFIIQNVTALDGGEYLCNVSNEVAYGESQVTVNVESIVTEQPEPVNVSIMVEDIELTCSAAGFPLPLISWLHNGKRLNQSDRVSITPQINDNTNEVTSLVVVSETVLSDTGLYQCIVTNLPVYAPVMSNTVTVLVQDIPDVLYNVTAVNVLSRSLLLKWPEPDDNNSPILGYFVFYFNPLFLNGMQVMLETEDAQEQIQINDLHPGATYTFKVVAFNDEGIGTNQTIGSQATTLDEAPNGSPMDLNGIALSGTEVFLIWSPPLEENRHGQIISYDIQYKGYDMNDTIVDDIKISNINETQSILKGLNEYTTYDVSVRARTSAGPGPYTPPITILTNESMPGPIEPPVVDMVNSTSAIIKWNEPEDPNGIIINYNIEFSALDFSQKPYSDRKRAISEDLLTCFSFLGRNDTVVLQSSETTQLTLTNLLPFTTYGIRIAAVTIAGPGNFSQPATTVSTTSVAPGVVINLMGTTRNASSIVIAWDAPPCPFGVIIGYRIYHTSLSTTQTSENIQDTNYTVGELLSGQRELVYDITGISLGRSYFIHVRAFSIDSNSSMLLGAAMKEITVNVTEELQLPQTFTATSTIEADHNSITVRLPGITSIMTDDLVEILYYSVVVVETDPNDEFDPETDNFDAVYPDLRSYDRSGDINKYYITAAWDVLNNIPSDFVIGDESTTEAVHNGKMEEYYNAKLKSSTDYCYFVFAQYTSTIANEVVIRFIFLGCTETEREPTKPPVLIIIIPILLALLLCCLCCMCIICLICCERKRRRSDKGDVSDKERIIPLEPTKRPKTAERAPIALIDFPLYVKEMHNNEDYPFSKEFEHIEPKHHPTYEASLQNKDKNRFSSVPAYDHSRVKLEKSPTENDYINANYINGYEDTGDFIATQGPMPDTVEDYWWMVWEKHIPVIVMLTNLIEKKRVKCHSYWPEKENVATKFGSILVTMDSEAVQTHQTIRTFTLECEVTSQVKKVTQYHFTEWPDHGVPKSTESLLQLIEYVRTMYKPELGPILTHCGTGVGRSGAFICLYVMLARLTRVTTVDIYNYVQYMRKQRISMVSNETEYIFVHDALVDALRIGMIKGYILGLNDDIPQQVTEISE